jgi:hypothetical protein
MLSYDKLLAYKIIQSILLSNQGIFIKKDITILIVGGSGERKTRRKDGFKEVRYEFYGIETSD